VTFEIFHENFVNLYLLKDANVMILILGLWVEIFEIQIFETFEEWNAIDGKFIDQVKWIEILLIGHEVRNLGEIVEILMEEEDLIIVKFLNVSVLMEIEQMLGIFDQQIISRA